MKSSYITARSVGAVTLVLAGAVHADVNKNTFDQWTVTNGNINSSLDCTTAFTCGAEMESEGFFSRLVKDNTTGKQYFQTIVTMPTASDGGNLDNLEFSDENFVSFSNTNGIIDKQRIYQTETLTYPSTTDTHDVTFKNGSVIGTGWATDFVELTQTIADPIATGGDGFQADFLYKQLGYSDGASLNPYAKGMKITNVVPISVDVMGNIVDRQDFVLVERQGDYTTANGSATLPPMPDATRGGTLTWSGDTSAGNLNPVDGDHIQALWIGEDLGATVGQQFGYGQYINFDTNSKISAFSLAETWGDPVTGVPNPILDWDTTLWGDLKTQGTITLPPGM